MIDVTVKVHDKYQLEIKLTHQFEENRRVSSYKVNFFLFIPNSLDINYSTYKKKDFYSDIQNYIRFKTPVYLINQIYEGNNSPYAKLRKACTNLVELPDKKTVAEYEYHLKMFSSITKSALRDYVVFIGAKTNPSEIVELTETFKDQVEDLCRHFRQLKTIINVPTVEKNIYAILLYGDEYLSLLIEKYTFKLLEFLKRIKTEQSDRAAERLLALIRSEINYRSQNGYESVPQDNSDNESVIFRFSVLKKYLESVLFIDTAKEPEGQFVKQLLISLAAGLAMLFATAVAFWGHSVYGSYTMPIFITLIVSYMLKDRIKELMRIFFTRKISRRLYDQRIKILSGNKKIGVFKEAFDFVKKKNLPQAIVQLRNLGRSKEFDSKFSRESVICYRKKIALYKNLYTTNYHDYQINGINDILRLNVSPFLKKMDNPDKPLYILQDKGYKKTRAQRVYHINLVIKYIFEEDEHLVRYRLVLNRRGIKRIEKIPSVI
ncbi:MAG TPA: hypothetical protein ENK44_17035 [Caldithrix abyssi]|uniref:Uncharacterized protein n=1 Tax=Caldithrix abyssi TaxID=187145 RepID=A0A7V4U3M8_CALAY|nr:hypothetical protein [Caldithrix abyssi]